MTAAGRSLLVLLLLGAALATALRARARVPALGPPVERAPCEIPVARAGVGVACFTAAEAAALVLEAGDRLEPSPSGLRRERMGPTRLYGFDVPIDPNTATPEELASLPGVGPGLARRIVAARPFSSVEDLGRVPGIGARRLRILKDRIRLGRSEGGRDGTRWMSGTDPPGA